MKNVLITGGAGFIGSNLANFLADRNCNVLVVDNLSKGSLSNLKNSNINFLEADVRDIVDIGTDWNYIFHLAGTSSLPENEEDPVLAYENNVVTTANMLRLARSFYDLQLFVFASTSAVYENNTNFPVEEIDEVEPDLVYSISKLAAERLCYSHLLNYNMPVISLRYFNTYGPAQNIHRQSPPLTAYIAKCLLMGERPVLHADDFVRRDYIHIDDLNHLHFLIMKDAAYRQNIFKFPVYNACSGKAYTVPEIYNVMCELIPDSPEAKYREPYKLWQNYTKLFTDNHYTLNKDRVSEEVNKNAIGSNRRIKSVIGWEPRVELEDGLTSVISSVRKQLCDS